MFSQTSRAPKLAFGPFEFDPASGELRKHGYRVKLPSQPSQILGALVERPGELVTREELRNRLWPGATAGDFDHGLNAAVNKLRQALGDAADQPRYVETLPGRGYRFVAPTHPTARAALELVPDGVEPEPQPSPRQSEWIGPVAALSLLVLAAASWIAFYRSSPPQAVRPAQSLVVPPKGYYLEGGGLRQAFALSPDGRRIAFTAKDASGGFRLFLRDLAESESRPVPDGEGAYSVVWSPDGQTLLFTAQGKLRRIAVNGSASQILSPAINYFCAGIPFGPDRLLVTNNFNSAVMPASGGTPRPIDQLYSWAQLLPGGKEFLYTNDDPQLGASRARIATIGSNQPGVEVVQADSRVQYTDSLHSAGGYLVYLRAGTLLAQPFDLAGHKVTAEPRAIARRLIVWVSRRCRLFGFLTRRVGLPVLYKPLAVHLGGPHRQTAFHRQSI